MFTNAVYADTINDLYEIYGEPTLDRFTFADYNEYKQLTAKLKKASLSKEIEEQSKRAYQDVINQSKHYNKLIKWESKKLKSLNKEADKYFVRYDFVGMLSIIPKIQSQRRYLNNLIESYNGLLTKNNLPFYIDIDKYAIETRIAELDEKMFNSLNLEDIGKVKDYEWTKKRGYRLTSPFGYRLDPINGSSAFHNGTDEAMAVGTEVIAFLNGYVEEASEDGGRGKFVTIRVADNVKYSFYHLSHILVEIGDVIKQGDVVAKSGTSGRSTGPHLHTSLYINGKARDLAKWLTYLQK